MSNIRILSSREYERMVQNGWRMVSLHAVHGPRRDAQIKELTSRYSRIKRYYMTTRVRGYYNDVWACKR